MNQLLNQPFRQNRLLQQCHAQQRQVVQRWRKCQDKLNVYGYDVISGSEMEILADLMSVLQNFLSRGWNKQCMWWLLQRCEVKWHWLYSFLPHTNYKKPTTWPRSSCSARGPGPYWAMRATQQGTYLFEQQTSVEVTDWARGSMVSMWPRNFWYSWVNFHQIHIVRKTTNFQRIIISSIPNMNNDCVFRIQEVKIMI